MAEATKPAATGQAGDISNATLMHELFDLYCLAMGIQALAGKAGQGEISRLASMLADRAYGLHNRIDEADVASFGGAA